MKKRILTAQFLTLAIIMFATSSLFAQPGTSNVKGGNMHHMMMKGNMDKTCNIPDLTDTQKEKIELLKTAHLKAMQSLKLDMQQLQTELKKLTIADKPDQDAINAKVDEISALQNKMMKAGLNHRMKVRALLTDKQKVYFDMHDGQGMHKGMHGMGPGMKGNCPNK